LRCIYKLMRKSASDSIPETRWYKMRMAINLVIAKLKKVLRSFTG